ncbi:MAG: CHAD domain-containing protein [Gemmataceae bacterium]|nr:CHAD domain-containing protein [Gemmataceae bacterium]
MSTGKWISDLSAEVRLADAARRVLSLRLEVVREYLGLALHEAHKDPEYVHQLRVGTRRASAALDIFALCLPEKIYSSSRKRLRKLRRAAGAARDWDVFLESVVRPPCKTSGRSRPGNDFLVGLAFGQRSAAQVQLQEANPDFPFAFERLTATVLHAIEQPASGINTLLDLARPVLTNLLRELDRAAARDLDDYGNLHQVRIAGKRLRYAMEVFAPCFGDDFRDRHYAAVEEMQDILGLANDSHVAMRRLREILDRLKATLPDTWKRYRGGIEVLLRFHEERLPQERGRFLKWWERWQESGGEKALASLVGPEAQALA